MYNHNEFDREDHMFLSRKVVPGWKCPQGHPVGQPIFYHDWLDDRACGVPVIKRGVHNPLFEGDADVDIDVDADVKFDWQLCFGSAIAGIIGVAALMMLIGAVVDGDALAMFCDIAELAR